MAFTFDSIFAVDPNNPANAARNAAITIFDPADPAQAPITIQDPTGSPLPNPITVDAAGMGPAFQHPTLARVGWKGAGFTNYFTSYEGMYNETVAAKDAAAASASEAAGAATSAVAAVNIALAAAVYDAEAAATSAAAAAALVEAPADTAIAAAVNGNGATKAALNSTIASATIESPNNLWVPLGDSHTDSNTTVSNTRQRHSDSYHFWARAYLEGALKLVYNAGIDGNTSTQMLARLQADVIDKLPRGGLCTIMAGTNDMFQSVPLATYKSNIASIVDRLTSARIVPILLTIPPLGINADPVTYSNPTSTSRTAAQLLYLNQVNSWLVAWGAANGITVVDLTTAITKTDNAAYPTNYTLDGVHGQPVAKRTIGKALADALRPFVKPTASLLASSNVDPTLLNTNPLFLDNNGTVPTGWTFSGTGSLTSVVGDVAGIRGKALTLSGWVRSGNSRILQSPLMNANTGDVISVAYKYKATGLEAKGLRPTIGIRQQGTTFSFASNQWTEADVSEPHTVYMEGALTKTSTTQIRFSIEPGTLGNADPAGGDSFSIGELTIRNLTTGQLVTL